MIKLKTEVNKSAIMRELQAKATEGFKNSWQPELQVKAYMNGVHDLFKLLRLSNVVERSEQLPCNHKQVVLVRHAAKCKDCGTVFENKW